MANYSPFFSSGLLAPNHYTESGALTPSLTSPLPTPFSPSYPIDNDGSTTPTPSTGPDADATIPLSPKSATPRLRKRRSSLTVSSSPMTAIKSPIRSAGLALQRAMTIGLVSPGRSHADSGSDMVGVPKVERKRSGSLGASLR